MQMIEMSRFIRGVQYIGWNNDQIHQLILYIGEGGNVDEKLQSIKDELSQNNKK